MLYYKVEMKRMYNEGLTQYYAGLSPIHYNPLPGSLYEKSEEKESIDAIGIPVLFVNAGFKMGNEVIFRSSPMGFNKEDVMHFVSEQKAKEAQLLAQIEELKNRPQPAQINTSNRVFVLEQDNALLEQREKQLTAALEQANQALEEKEAQIAALTQRLQEHHAAPAPAAEPPAAPQAAAEPSPAADMVDLQTQAEKLRSLESQLGSAILDARRYSDRLIHDAKAKSIKISGDTYLVLNETTARVGELSSQMDSFKASCDETLLSLQSRLAGLSKKLESIASEIVEQLESSKAELAAAADSGMI